MLVKKSVDFSEMEEFPKIYFYHSRTMGPSFSIGFKYKEKDFLFNIKGDIDWPADNKVYEFADIDLNFETEREDLSIFNNTLSISVYVHNKDDIPKIFESLITDLRASIRFTDSSYTFVTLAMPFNLEEDLPVIYFSKTSRYTESDDNRVYMEKYYKTIKVRF